MTEILSPAGSVESFFAAVNGGADGVYLGLDLFSARKNAKNFTRAFHHFYGMTPSEYRKAHIHNG